MKIPATFGKYLPTGFFARHWPRSAKSSYQLNSGHISIAVTACSTNLKNKYQDTSNFLMNTAYFAGPSIEEMGLPVYIISDDEAYMEDVKDDEECMIDILSVV